MSIYKSLKCQRCGHEWFARVMNVRLCPRCKSHLWARPKESPSPRLKPTADFERMRDYFMNMGISFRRATFESVNLEPEQGLKRFDEVYLKSRHEIVVGGNHFLFDENGRYLGYESGGKFSPRKKFALTES